MEQELKYKLQERLKEHFDKFVELKINNISMSVMPMGKDIPIINKALYDKTNDSLEIFMTSESNLTERQIGNICIYYTKDNALAGFKFNKITELITSNLKIQTMEKINKEKNVFIFKSHHDEYSKKDVENRKFSFLNDILSNPILDFSV